VISDTDGVYLAPAEYIDSDHPAIVAQARAAAGASATERARQYYLVAREIRYDPDLDYSDPETYRASSVLQAGAAYCVGKAALFAALCRAGGIPARVAFGDVTNHLSSEKLREKMGTN
jgi:transglutaminase-like putative cysteine protease